jgi:phosphoribosylformylglycinamidine synthase
MLSGLAGMELGIWVAHGEGRFVFPYPEEAYNVVMKYSSSLYPANPNGSMYDVAGICSADGRHLAMMPHLERAYLPWQCAFYPPDRRNDEITPWLKAYVSAREWVENKAKGNRQ